MNSVSPYSACPAQMAKPTQGRGEHGRPALPTAGCSRAGGPTTRENREGAPWRLSAVVAEIWWAGGTRRWGKWSQRTPESRWTILRQQGGQDLTVLRRVTCRPVARVPGGSEIWFKIKVQTDSNYIQIYSNFDRSKQKFSEIKKFEIKYGCEFFE
jgi:hypothetical protein